MVDKAVLFQMIKPHHKKIVVYGNSGSGKTTLAFILHKKLNIPLYHLDQYHWKPNWERASDEQFFAMHTALCNERAWIMEGVYTRILHERIAHADVVIFLDMPRYLCMWRVLKRALFNTGKQLPGDPVGCKQNVLSYKFLEFFTWVWNFNKRNRPVALELLQVPEVINKKCVYILRSPQEIKALIAQLGLYDAKK